MALQHTVGIFNDSTASHQNLVTAGETFLTAFFAGKITESLNTKRFQIYMKIASRERVEGNFQLTGLPPTSEAAHQHFYRVFYQVQEWKGVLLNPIDWGWKRENGRLKPITTLREPAPEKLLKIVSCNCKSGCEYLKCECRKNGLHCSSMCGYCTGHGCSNRTPTIEEDDDVDNMTSQFPIESIEMSEDESLELPNTRSHQLK